MIERLANTFVACVELLEAEGRLVKDRAARVLGSAALVGGLSVLALVGALTLGVGATWLLAERIGVPGALCTVGLCVALGGGWGAHEALRRLRRDSV
ncbi:MAG: hypothetical protein ACIARR_10015 [Phycisphaerales bacterium JB059]